MKKRFYQIDKTGSIDELKLREGNLPMPGDLEVTVEVKSIGLNFADIFAIQGLYKAAPKMNFIPGLEYSGIITKTGKLVRNLEPGNRIMGVTRFGGYSSHINIDRRYVYKLPDDWTLEEGAGFLVHVLTAYYGMVYLGGLETGSTVLIHSAAGGVGIWANRIAKKYSAFTIGTIGNPGKMDFCKKEGCNKVIVRSDDFEDDLRRALNGRDLNLVMDCIGGKIFKTGYRMLAPQGRIVAYGSARYASPGSKPNFLKMALTYWRRPKIDPQTIINYNKAIMGFNLIYLYEKTELMGKLLEEISRLNLPKPVIGHSFEFERIHEAIYFFQRGNNIGKVVVNI